MFRKSSIPLVVAATIALCALSSARAAEPAPHPKPIPPPATGVVTPNSGLPAFDAGKRLAALTEQLKLTPVQQAEMKPVLEDTETKVKAARAPGTPPSAALDKVKSILDGADIQIRVILDGAQKEEWERMKEDVKNANRRTFKTAATPVR
jgi:Spy/CpxP family protein refolding chaperone